MESVTRILYCINLVWITDTVEQQYVMTARTVIQVGSNMTGTDLCVNKMEIVPVIFEPLRSFKLG